jgi:hypothetical protein
LERPLIFTAGLLIAWLTWVALIAEYRLAPGFLDLPLTLTQTVIVITAARLAFLLPSPSGLRSQEASQMIAMHALGFSPAAGIGISILVRARDVIFGLTHCFWLVEFQGDRMQVRGWPMVQNLDSTGEIYR